MRSFSEKKPMNRSLLSMISASCVLFSSSALALDHGTGAADEPAAWEDENDSLLLLADEGEGFIEEDSFFAAAMPEDSNQLNSRPNADPFPTARPVLDNPWGITFSGDFLYWRPQEDCLSYALPSPLFANDPYKGVNGKVARLSPEYQAGFRLGLELDLPRDDWDLFLSWTSYHNSHHDSATAPDGEVLFPFWTNLNYDPLPLKASARFDVHFNTLDLTLGRSIFVGKFLALRPFAGFQAAWINQQFNLDYAQVTFTNGATTPFLYEKNRNNSQGYGLTMGMDSKWELGWGFYIEGDLSASLLWTDFDIAQFEKNSNGSPRSQIKDSFKLVTAAINLFGGLAWEKRFNRDRIYIELHAGWEEQVWFSQNQLNRFVDAVNVGDTLNLQSDLALSGWTIGAKLGF